MNIYQQNILDHYKFPKNAGVPDWKPTHTFTLVNLSCGDEVTVYLLIEQNILKGFSFTGRGCSISIAATSLLSEQIKGKTISEIEKLTVNDVVEILGIELSINRLKCADLGLQATKEAIFK